MNNKIILKNTLFLYLRMILLMFISLYTSRIVLKVLGFEDFGIYNVVGGVIVLFSFINNALVSSSKRFINIAISTNDSKAIKKVFSSSITVHIIISLIIIFFAETVGLWFLNSKLNIPVDRVSVALWVYQFSVVSTVFGIIITPYTATIIAYERMGIYAYIGIIEGILKLLIVYIVQISSIDKLVLYSFLILLVCLLTGIINIIYVRRKFPICRFKINYDRKLFKDIFSFSGWSLFGQIAYIGATQGINMVVNIFCGVMYNAAIGIGQQVNSAIFKFVSSFQTAFNPQIIQTYSTNRLNEHRQLISLTTRISFFLLIYLSFPIMFNIDYILKLWLGEFPDKTTVISNLIIIVLIIDALCAPLYMSMQAIGNIRNYQIIISIINFMNLPLAYLCLKNNMDISYVYYIQIIINTIMYIFRIVYILPRINYKINAYVLDTLFPIIVVFSCSYCIVKYISSLYLGFYKLLIDTLLSIFVITVFILIFGINNIERKKILKYIKK